MSRSTLLLLALLLITGTGLTQVVLPVAHAQASDGSLSVSVVPPVLPADGGSYRAIVVSILDSSGHRTVALQDTIVYLTSSSLGIAAPVQASVVIEEGISFVVANVSTTRLPGSTRILAVSAGLASGFGTVTTSVPTGFPSRVGLVAVPDSTVASLGGTGTLIVELLDAAGMPARAISPISVSLMSSNPKVVNTSLTTAGFSSGTFLVETSYRSGFVPGVATISGQAAGLSAGDATVNVLGPVPLALQLFAQPNRIVQSCSPSTYPPSCEGRLVVMLTGPSGNPAPAQKNTLVQLRSSSQANVTLPQTVLIPAGRISAMVSFTAHQVSKPSGSSKITASADGLVSSIIQISTYRPEGRPMGLSLYVGPNPILADHGSYSSVVASLLNGSGYPTVNSSAIAVTITSSNVGIGNFSSLTFGIAAGAGFGSITITSTFLAGSTALTASAPNLLPAQTSLSAAGAVPAKVVVKVISQDVPADGGAYAALKLTLEDALGEPAIAPSDVPVFVQSSRSDIAQLNSVVVIPQGDVSVVADVTTTKLAGTTNITAYSSSFGSGTPVSWTLLGTVLPAPSQVGAYLYTPSVIMTPSNTPSLIVQLQDGAGNPSRASRPTGIQVISSDASVINTTTVTTVNSGADFVAIPLDPVGTGATVLTVTSPGLSTASVTLNVVPLPISVKATATPSNTIVGGEIFLSVGAALDGKGLQGAQVTWTSAGGTIAGASATTDSGGAATASFTANQVGGWTEYVKIIHPVLGTFYASVSVVINPPPKVTTTQPSPFGLTGYVSLTVVALVVLGVVLIFLFIRRNRRSLEVFDYEEAIEEPGSS